jgi:hypothetical protein
MPVIGKTAVVVDIAVRCGVIVVTWLLIREFWAEEIGPNGDGPPLQLLSVLLGVYVVWNIWVIGRSIRAWVAGSITETSFLALLGTLSVARLLWLRPLADDHWDRHHERLMILVVASITCAVLALAEALRGSTARYPVADRHDEVGPAN